QQHSPRCLRNGTCIYYYLKLIIPETYIDERGYMQYRCRTHDDAWVVPYNPILIMKLECHINFEIASTVHLFMYLYKYLFKGPDYIKFTVNNADTTNFNNPDHFEPTNFKTTDILPNTNHQSNSQYINEFSDYIKGRYLSAPEAAWRIFRYHITSTDPP
ncbi:3977_t:CDS:1, partial [Cetraspora pellucida]